MKEKVLEVRDLRVTFNTPLGPLAAVRGVDLDVYGGEMVAVVGESGSGKSVSFLAAMGLLPRTATVEGSVVLQGEQLVGAAPKKLRSVRGRLMSMIFQDPLSALNPVHKIGAQISEMLRAHQSMSEKAALARAVDLLEIVGIPQPGDRAQQYPHEFSGGMRQRVVIAMAIANSPKLLIADEPTTALDVTVQAQILEVIQRVQAQFGTAVVLITHDLGVVARVCERVNVMYAGRVVERANIMDVFDQPTHPYTRGLLASLPQTGVERLVPINGFPPNMLKPPSGCAFRPRCTHATDACGASLPELQPGRLT
ncbi:MAG: ABC transporter ATP-binding protein [Actinobacteria bacterium]|nr:ABC transporter ATP-binding protein [Actinomycetota bacterium]